MRTLTSILATILILVILAAATPFVTGMLFKRTYLDRVAAVQAHAGPNAKIELVSYKLGWISSDVVWSVKMTNPSPASQSGGAKPLVPDVTVTLNDHVTHGPILFDHAHKKWGIGFATIQSTFQLPPAVAAILYTFLPDSPRNVEIDTWATFNDEYITEVKIPAFVTNILGGGQLSWKGLTGSSSVTFSDALQRFSKGAMKLNIGAVSLQSDLGAFSSENAILEYKATMGSMGLWTGHYSMQLPGMSVNTVDKGDVVLKKR